MDTFKKSNHGVTQCFSTKQHVHTPTTTASVILLRAVTGSPIVTVLSIMIKPQVLLNFTLIQCFRFL